MKNKGTTVHKTIFCLFLILSGLLVLTSGDMPRVLARGAARQGIQGGMLPWSQGVGSCPAREREAGQKTGGVLEPETATEARLNRLQPPDRVMDAIGVKPGMVVAEIGAGHGRYAVQLAVRVGEKGKVYAEDIDAVALKHLESRCGRWGLRNVEAILGEVKDPRLPEASLDLIFIISSYHHFDDPVALLQNARPALKPDGRLAIVEWAPRDGAGGEYKTPEEMEAQMTQAGYKLDRIDTFLLSNGLYIYIFNRAD